MKESSKVFDTFPDSHECPICKKSGGDNCVLVPMMGTEDRNICEGKPFHLDCILDTIAFAERFAGHSYLLGLVCREV
jgi:rubredoxin